MVALGAEELLQVVVGRRQAGNPQILEQAGAVAVGDESNRNRGAARAAAANGAGWTLLAGMAGDKGVNRSWSVPSRVRV